GVALDLRARLLDQPVVLHAGRARGHARHAAEALVDVRDHLGRDLRALLVADAHQHDPPARRAPLVLEHRVAGAPRQAEAAVHAVADQVQLGWALGIPGDRHYRPPTKAPGRKIRAGSKRSFTRAMTASAPGSGPAGPQASTAVRTAAGASVSTHARG